MSRLRCRRRAVRQHSHPAFMLTKRQFRVNSCRRRRVPTLARTPGSSAARGLSKRTSFCCVNTSNSFDAVSLTIRKDTCLVRGLSLNARDEMIPGSFPFLSRRDCQSYPENQVTRIPESSFFIATKYPQPEHVGKISRYFMNFPSQIYARKRPK